jgi:O-antigen/teichoic acid export membrane protein
MTLKQKAMKGALWEFSGRIGLQGVGFFVSVILARILAPEDFGLLAIVTVFIYLAAAFVDSGFTTALIQRDEVNESHYASVFYLNVVLGFLLALIVFFLAPFIADIYNNNLLKNLIRFMSLSFIVSSFCNATRAHLIREMKFKLISLSNIIAALFSGIIAIYMATNGYGVWSLAVQSIINTLIANIILHIFSKFRYALKFNFNSIKELWTFSSRILLTGLADILFNNADTLVIGKLLNPAILGFYYRAKSLENFSMRYTAATISSVLLPSLSAIQNDTDRLKQAVLKSFHLLSFISFLGCGLLLVTGNEVILLLFSKKWEPSVIFFQIIISGAFASQIFVIFHNTLLSTGNVGEYLKINFVSKILLFLNFISLFIWGINIYLVLFTFIQIATFFSGIFFVTRLLGFGQLLYIETIKYLSVYVSSVVIVFLFKYYLPVSELFYCLISASLLFCCCFLIISYILNVHGLFLFLSEVVKPSINNLSKIKNSLCNLKAITKK